eukprot:scaffold7039_cov117-Skeletonema_marinoi.AAC.2
MVGGFESYLDMLKRKARQENTPLIYLFIRLTIPRLAITVSDIRQYHQRVKHVAHEQGDLLEQRPETEEIFVRSRRCSSDDVGLGR